MADNKLTVIVDGKDNLSPELKRIESGVIRFVGAVSSALAAISAIAFPIAESARFQKELLEAGKTTEYTKEQLMALKQGLADLSTQVNVSAIDLAKIATMGGQLGIGGDGNSSGLISFVREIATAVTALDVPAEEAVTAIGKLINIFNVPSTKYRNLVSALNEVSNKSNATASELFDVTRRIGDLGGSVDIPQAAALSASMIDLGLTAETAGTTVTKIFADMKSKAAEFSNFIGGTMTPQKWVELLQGNGLKALDLYLDKLNAIPPAAAAAAKIDLTGGGRIFEAVTKLQQQRQRAAVLENRAIKETTALEANRASMSAEQIGSAEESIKLLEKQAVQVNVVTRLLDAANKSYESGDSAIKEQQTVLAGLSAQWTVFLNNVKKVAMGLGDVALLPLTDMLRAMSQATREVDVGAQLGDGFRDVIEVVRTATEYLSYFTKGIKDVSTGVDWGAALRIAALLSAIQVLRTLSGVAASLGTRLVDVVPGARLFSNALFGTAKSTDAAAAAGEKAAASTQRVGGVYQKVQGALASFATKMTEIDRLYAEMARGESQLAASQAAHAAQLQSISNLYGQLGRRLQTRAAIEASLAAATARRDAAMVAGNNRAIASNNLVIARLTPILATLRQLESQAYNTGISITKLNRDLNETSQRITALSTGAARMVEAFRAAREAGASLGVALAAAFQARGSGGITTFASSITAAFASATRAVVNFGATARLAFQVGASGSTGLRAALLGIQNAATVTGYVLKTALGNSITNGVAKAGTALLSLRGWILQTAMAAAGLGAEWQTATSRMAQGALLATAAVRGLAGAVSFLKKAMLSILNIAFFAIIIKDALEFLGIWNTVAGVIEKAFVAMGGDKNKIPEWLRTSKTADAIAKASAEQAKAQEATAEAASRYNKEMETTLMFLRDAQNAATELSFNPAAPTASIDSAMAGVEALITAESKLIELRKAEESQNKSRLALSEELVVAQRQLDEKQGKAGGSTAKRNYDDTAAALRGMTDALSKTREELAAIERDAPGTAENLANSLLSASNASKVLGRDTATNKSLLEKFAEAQARVLEANQKIAAAQEADPAGLRAPTSSKDGAARTEGIRNTIEALKVEREKAQKEVAEFEQKMREAAPGNLALEKTVERMKAALDPAAIKSVATRFSDSALSGLSKFDGKAIPKITAGSILDSAATKVVATQMRDMYQSLANAADEASKQAKNAYAQAMQETKRATKEAVDAVGDLNRAWQQASQKAKNFKLDQQEDKQVRERLSELDMAQRKEEEIANARYAAGSDMLRRELLGIREKYRAEREAIEQTAQFAKAKRVAGQDIQEYEKLKASVQSYAEQLKKVNAILADPNATNDDRAKAIEDQKRLYIEAQEEFGRMRQAAQRLASLDPIGDKPIISEEQKNKFIADVGTLGKVLAGINQEGAPAMEAVLVKLAGSYGELAKKYQQIVESMNLNIRTFQEANKKTMGEVVTDLTTAMARTDDYAKKLGELSTLVSTVKLSPGTISTDDIEKQGTAIAEQLATSIAKAKKTTVPLTVDQKALRVSLSTAFTDLTGDNGVKPPPMKLQATLADGVTQAISDKIVAEVKPKITVEVEIDGNGNRKLKASDSTGRFARGGLVGALQAFASGGKVRGPGTGTSDSILARLSHGEYVMDALTTSRFGAKFFAGLQAAARGGRTAAAKLGNWGVPAFATGGPVGTVPYSGVPSGVAEVSKGLQAQRDSVEVTLNVGNKKVSLFGARQQADDLVKAFKTLEAGT